jgi:hypothetical protein
MESIDKDALIPKSLNTTRIKNDNESHDEALRMWEEQKQNVINENLIGIPEQ